MANANPEVQSLYSELIEHMKQGVDMHEQLADYYGFLNLPGYQKCHEYHMLCELLAYRKAKHEYMKEFHQLVPPMNLLGLANMANNGSSNSGGRNGSNNGGNQMNRMSMGGTPVIPQGWYSYTRYDVDAGTKRNAVKDGFNKWIEYEKETKEFLVNMIERLKESGYPQFVRKVEFLLDEVEKEISHGEEKLLMLENTGYDMNFILQQQEELVNKYASKIRGLNMKDYQYRPAGLGNYANYNLPEDEDEDFTYEMESYARRGGRARDSRGRYV